MVEPCLDRFLEASDNFSGSYLLILRFGQLLLFVGILASILADTWFQFGPQTLKTLE